MSSKAKCSFCSKKMGLVQFSCRCGGTFCLAHRSDIDHKCSFDYRAEGMKSLSTSLEKVIASKVDQL
jgi:hypothetical protein